MNEQTDVEQGWKEAEEASRDRYFPFSSIGPEDGVWTFEFLTDLEKPKASEFAWGEATVLCDPEGERRRYLFAPSSNQLKRLFESHHPVKGKRFELAVRGEGYDRRWRLRRVVR